jgi:two-component system, LuxR family, response regulator FixJ
MAPEKTTAQRMVHVIDDDEALRESLAFLLRAAQLEVKSYSSAKAFLVRSPTNLWGVSSPTCECRT